MHYRRMFDSNEFLFAYDLEDAKGRDVVVEIEKVSAGEITGEKGRKNKLPVVKFVGREKKLGLNKTNGKSIARLYGNDTDKWPGKSIALYVTNTEFNGESRECIRVRPFVPEANQRSRGNDRSDQLQEQIRQKMDEGGATPSDDTTAPSDHDNQDNPGASHE